MLLTPLLANNDPFFQETVYGRSEDYVVLPIDKGHGYESVQDCLDKFSNWTFLDEENALYVLNFIRLPTSVVEDSLICCNKNKQHRCLSI